MRGSTRLAAPTTRRSRAPVPPVGLLLLSLAPASLGQAVEGEGASLAELASHDGEIFFAGALRKTIPPNATAVTQQSAVPCPCKCESADTAGLVLASSLLH